MSLVKDHSRRTRQSLAALVCLLCFGSGVICHRSHFAAKSPSAGPLQARPTATQFVIADLDGDQIPDLALVELGSLKSAQTSYSIRLQFGGGAQSAIGVEAPFGGLRVAARDVNGDDHIDLILTSNLDERFIEVLLNDGHGNFSQAASDDYAQLLDETPLRLNGPISPRVEQSTLASLRSTFGEEGVLNSDLRARLALEFLLAYRNESALNPQICLCQDRAPPTAVAFS